MWGVETRTKTVVSAAWLLSLGVGCRPTVTVQTLPAEHFVQPVRVQVVARDEPRRLEGMREELTPTPLSDGQAQGQTDGQAEGGDTVRLVQARTSAAPRTLEQTTQSPTRGEIRRHRVEFTHLPNTNYRLVTAPSRVTDIALQPGERITGKVVVGDNERWTVGGGVTMTGGLPQPHVHVRPEEPGLFTNLFFHTNLRSYFLELESREEDYLAEVRWLYPDGEYGSFRGGFAGGIQSTELDKSGDSSCVNDRVAASELDANYAFSVTSGKPPWQVEAVYNDGQRTFIRFARGVESVASPVFHVMSHGQAQVANWIVCDRMYVVDEIFQRGRLQLGDPDNGLDTVMIWRS